MAEQLFQVGIKGLIRNKEGHILLVHVGSYNGRPGHWDMPGGRMDPGENFEQTLSREIKEETGINYSVKPTQLKALLASITIKVADQDIPLVVIVYELAINERLDVKLDPNSAEDKYGWFSPSEAAGKLAVKYDQDFCQLIRLT